MTETREIALIREEAGGLGDAVRELVVADTASAHQASELLVFIANTKRKLESQRVFLVKPLNDHVKNINAEFKEWVKPLNTADSLVRRKVLNYQRVLDALRLDAEGLAALDDTEPANEPEEDWPDLPVLVSRITRSDRGSTSVRKTWTYEVTHEAAVPREYLVIDEGAIGLAVRSGVRDIAGVRIYQEESLSVRTR